MNTPILSKRIADFYAILFLPGNIRAIERITKLTKKEIISSRRSQILSLARKYGIRNVRLFGSVVRGEDNSDSDADFLIDLEPDRGLVDHAGFMVELEKLLGIKVDVVTENGLKDSYRKRVLEEAVTI